MSPLAPIRDAARADDLYAELVSLYEGLDEPQSALASAKLIIVLANHIGDPSILREACRLARA